MPRIVLNRRVGEQIVIVMPPTDRPVRVLVDVAKLRSCGQVHIGVTADAGVTIDRAEVRDAKDLGTKVVRSAFEGVIRKGA